MYFFTWVYELIIPSISMIETWRSSVEENILPVTIWLILCHIILVSDKDMGLHMYATNAEQITASVYKKASEFLKKISL